MQAIVYDGQVKLQNDYPTPRPRDGQVLVAVSLAGVCKTDLEVAKGYLNFRGVMGHEFVGTVVHGPAAWKGKRVVGEINCVCGRCDMCRRGLSNHCRARGVLGIDRQDGVFAQYVALPAANLHAVPAGLTDEQAVFAEPLAAAFQIARQISISHSDRVIVLGDGRLGQLAARVIKRYTPPLLVGHHAAKLEAAEKAQIQTALADKFKPAADADIVVDATGTAAGLQLAMQAVRPRGTIVLKSTFADSLPLNLAAIVINEITVVGSRCGPFEPALAALAQGEIDVWPLVSRRFPLAQGVAALEAAADGHNIKVLIDVA